MGISSESHLRPGLQAFSSGLIAGTPATFFFRCSLGSFGPSLIGFLVGNGTSWVLFFSFLLLPICPKLSPQHEWCSYVRGQHID